MRKFKYKTKAQRKKVYEYLLKNVRVAVEEGFSPFLCWKLWIIMGNDHNKFSGEQEEEVFDAFPELGEVITEWRVANDWRYTTAQRRAVLKKCIRLCLKK